jgi:predicted permease
MPPKFVFPTYEQVWIPFQSEFPVRPRNDRNTSTISIIGRLKPGVGPEATTAGLATLASPYRTGRELNLADIQTAALAEAARPQVGQFSRLLAITVGLLLLTGCLTVGTLLLLRTEVRRDEFATCLALGATRKHLAGGVVVEGALLAGAGALLAVPVSWALLSGLRTFELPGGISMKLMEIPIDGRTLAAAAAAGVLATMAIALVAGVFGLSANVADTIRARSGATQRIGRRRTRAILVVAEIAVAIVLLCGAGLFIRSLSEALSLNPGFDVSHIASGGVSLRPLGYSPERAAAFFDELRTRLGANAAIRSASMTVPQGGMSAGGRLVIDSVPRKFPSFVGFTAIDEHYLPTMGLAVTQGRNFAEQDTATSPRVALVSESFGRLLANGGDPVGHRMNAPGGTRPGQPPPQIEIVGVVPDIVVNVNALEPLAVYLPISQVMTAGSRTVVIRATRSAAAAVHETVGVVRDLVPALAPPDFTTMDGQIARQMGPQRLGATVLGALGVIAALLTLFGTYVLAESMSAIRRREMGIRAALGATRFELGQLIMRETTRLVGAGILLGAVLSGFGAGLIRSFLYRLRPFDAPTMASVIVAMVVLALAVTLKPALRAGRVDLSQVLRDE